MLSSRRLINFWARWGKGIQVLQTRRHLIRFFFLPRHPFIPELWQAALAAPPHLPEQGLCVNECVCTCLCVCVRVCTCVCVCVCACEKLETNLVWIWEIQRCPMFLPPSRIWCPAARFRMPEALCRSLGSFSGTPRTKGRTTLHGSIRVELAIAVEIQVQCKRARVDVQFRALCHITKWYSTVQHTFLVNAFGLICFCPSRIGGKSLCLYRRAEKN